MITINTNSWHYKLVGFFFQDKRASLCTYFWSLMLSLFIGIPFLVIALTTIAALFILLPFMELYFIIVHDLPFEVWEMVYVLIVHGVVLATLGFVGLFIKAEENNNIVVHFIKAKKHKFCPGIKYVYENN